MSTINVRNLDPEVWRCFGSAARGRRARVGSLLTAVLQEWLRAHGTMGDSREQRAKAAAGMFAQLQPGRCLSEELLADRRAEEAAES
jgi:hypothetical protein